MLVLKILLWSFVLNLGVVFGAGLYEARISVARWLGPSPSAGAGWHPEEAKRDDTGRRFWALTTTLPLTVLTFANLWAAWHSQDAVRAWWLTAAVAALGDRLFTFAYFIPRMVQLMRTSDSPEARSSMKQWATLNYLRLALILIAWVAAMETFGRIS